MRYLFIATILATTVLGLGFEDHHTDMDPIACGTLQTFEDHGTYLRDVFVSPTGTGDCSQGEPCSFSQATSSAQPGDTIHLSAGTYSGGQSVSSLHGTAQNPIQILGEGNVVFSGGGNCIQFSRCRYLVVRNIKCTGANYNGFNVDDGGEYSNPQASEHLIFDNVEIYNIGTGGNNDCLKLSGLDNFLVINSYLHDGSSGGSGIDMVGCHDGIIMNNRMENMGHNFVQTKGGSRNITIHGNLLKGVTYRGVNMGGSTGLQYYRPPVADMAEPYEARHIRTTANVFIDTNSAVAYTGCDECLVANNVIYKPRHWIFRILQEITTLGGYTFVPSRRGEFVNNIIFFDDNDISTYVNIGSNTEPGSFRFANNLWYADDNPSFSGANLPTTEISPIIQQDPLFVDEAGEDFHIGANSPASGSAEPGWINTDYDSVCSSDDVGAFSVGSSWRFAVAGDTRSGHNDHRDVVAGIIEKIPNSERVTVINTGDVTGQGSASQWETWAGIVAPLDVDWNKDDPPEYIGALGNHDDGTSGWLNRWKQYLPAQIGLSAYSGVNGNNDGLYGSVKYRNALFVWVDSTTTPSGQEQFIEDTLSRAAQDQDVEWTFVAFHHPPIPCGSKSDWSLGKTWHDDYFVPHGVDIVLLGHAHYYERTCPITDASTKTCDESNRGNMIGDTNGVIHVIAGGGGAPTYNPDCTVQCSDCPWLEKGDESHGFMEVEISGNSLTGRVWNTDDDMALVEQFQINKGQGPQYPQIPQNLVATAVSDTQINLTWDESNDPVGISHYNIYRDNTYVGQSSSNNYLDTGLSEGTSYSYRVLAVNNNDDQSQQSSPVSENTMTCIDNSDMQAGISQWQTGSSTIPELMSTIAHWKGGCQ